MILYFQNVNMWHNIGELQFESACFSFVLLTCSVDKLCTLVYKHFPRKQCVLNIYRLVVIRYIYLFIYKLRTQCHTIIAETVQNSNRHWRNYSFNSV